jgi:hypothetical protein
MRDLRNVGGTPGGFGTFVLGLALAITGGYLLMQQVDVHGGYYWSWGGVGGRNRSFGMTLIPLLLGIVILFVNGSSWIGKLLTYGGGLLILVGIIANLDINFRTTSLFNTLLMLALLMSGIGLIIRSARPMGGGGGNGNGRSRPDAGLGDD